MVSGDVELVTLSSDRGVVVDVTEQLTNPWTQDTTQGDFLRLMAWMQPIGPRILASAQCPANQALEFELEGRQESKLG